MKRENILELENEFFDSKFEETINNKSSISNENSFSGISVTSKNDEEKYNMNDKDNISLSCLINELDKVEEKNNILIDLKEDIKTKFDSLEIIKEINIKNIKENMMIYYYKIINEMLEGTFKRKKKRVITKIFTKRKKVIDNYSEVLDKSLEFSEYDFSMTILTNNDKLNKSHDINTYSANTLIKQISSKKYFKLLKKKKEIEEHNKNLSLSKEQNNETESILGEYNNKEIKDYILNCRNELINKKYHKSFVMQMKIIMNITSLNNIQNYNLNSDLQKLRNHIFKQYFFDNFIYIKLSNFDYNKPQINYSKYRLNKNNFEFCLFKYFNRNDKNILKEFETITERSTTINSNVTNKTKKQIKRKYPRINIKESRGSSFTIDIRDNTIQKTKKEFKKDLLLLCRSSFLNRQEVYNEILKKEKKKIQYENNKLQFNILTPALTNELTKEGFIYKTGEILARQKLKLKTNKEKLFCYIREKNLEDFQRIYLKKTGYKDKQEKILKDKSGNTLLIFAVKCNAKKIVEFLLEHGENINSQDNDGNTALHIALRNHYFEMVDLLIKNQADEEILNNLKLTPWEYIDYIESG